LFFFFLWDGGCVVGGWSNVGDCAEMGSRVQNETFVGVLVVRSRILVVVCFICVGANGKVTGSVEGGLGVVGIGVKRCGMVGMFASKEDIGFITGDICLGKDYFVL